VSYDTTRVLRTLAANLALGRTIAARSDHEQATLATLAGVIGMVASQSETAVAWLVRENAALRALFGQASAVVEDPGLRAGLDSAAAETDSSLRLSQLRAANRSLRSRLIELHAHIEDLQGEAARRTEAAIWAELRESVQRREPPLD
jgi:hypothetical protein